MRCRLVLVLLIATHLLASVSLHAQTQKWEIKLGGWLHSPPALAKDGTIYIGASGDAKALFAVNPDGTKRWEYPVPGNVTTAPVVGQFGTIYFSADDDKIRALTPDGKKLWEYYVSTGVKASPSVGPDETIYIAATQRLYALHPDGTEKWVYWGKTEINSSPAIGSDGTLYVGTSDGGQFGKKYLYAFNPDGTVKWKHPVPHRIASSPSIGRDGTIYVGCSDNNVYAFTPNGEKKWAFNTGWSLDTTPVIGSDDTLYVGSAGIYALNPDGSQKWVFKKKGISERKATPAIGNDGTLYVTTKFHPDLPVINEMFALSLEGKLKPGFNPKGSHMGSPVISSDGTLFIGSWDGVLHAYNIPSSGPANSPWPMYGHNEHRTNSQATGKPMPPVIMAQPQHQYAKIGGTVVFSVTAKSRTGMEYQWHRDRMAIKGETDSSYTLSEIVKKDFGATFNVTIKNEVSEVTSASAILQGPLEKKWEHYTEEGARYTPAIDSKGTLYYCTDTKIQALDENGEQTWEFEINRNTNDIDYLTSSPLVIGRDGTLYAGFRNAGSYPEPNSRPYFLQSIHPVTGKRWKLGTGGRFLHSPAIGNDGTIYISMMGNKILAVRPNGKKRWQVDTGGDLHTSPTVGRDGTIHVGAKGFVYAFTSAGKGKWEFKLKTPQTLAQTTPTIGSDGTVYVAAWNALDSTIYAINPDGSKKWEIESEGVVQSFIAIAVDGTLYAGTYSRVGKGGRVYALNSDGTKKWVYKTSEGVSAAPVIGSDGSLYMGLSNGLVIALTPDGNDLWRFESNGDIKHPLAMDENGTLFIVGFRGKTLYALSTDSTGPIDAPWAMKGQNAQRTGQASATKPITALKLKPLGTTDTLFSFSFASKQGITYAVEVSENLQQWQKLGEIKGTLTGSAKFTDPRQPIVRFKRNYYRVRQLD
jgi:outer membrane protein assembly factor BamB